LGIDRDFRVIYNGFTVGWGRRIPPLLHGYAHPAVLNRKGAAMTKVESDFLSARQAGERMGLPHKEVIRRIRKGDIEAQKLGGWNWVLTEDGVARAMKSDWYRRNHSAKQ